MATKATPVEFLLSQVRNATGSIAGGTVEFYEAGASPDPENLKTIWLDRDKVSIAANPYELDANGKAKLFADGIYKIIVKNAAGSTVDTIDGMPFISNDDLEDGTGDINIDSVISKDPIADIRAFGAVEDTDVSEAVAAALATGKPVYIPDGRWIVDDVTLPAGAVMFGAGRVNTIIVPGGTGFCFRAQGAGTTETSIVRGYLHDFTIDGETSATAAGGILLDWAYIWSLERVYVKRFYSAGAIGFHVKDAFNVNFTSCQAIMGGPGNLHGTGFKVSSTASTGQNVTQIRFDDCLAQYCTTGAIFDCDTAADGITITNCGIGRNTIGVDFLAGTYHNVKIAENHIELNDIGVRTVATFRGAEISDNFWWNDDIALDMTSPQNVRFAANIFKGTPGARTTLKMLGGSDIVWESSNATYTDAYTGMNLSGGTVLRYTATDPSEVVLNTNASTPVLQLTRDYYVFSNANVTNVSDFSGARPGATLTFRFNDAKTRVFESATVKLREGGVYGLGSILTLYTPDGITFYELTRRIPRENVVPTDGTSIFSTFTHAAGDIRYRADGIANGWRCTVGGTPGTWVPIGAGKGVTASRPTLTANDQGYMYFDTTVGYPIYWNGSAWKKFSDDSGA